MFDLFSNGPLVGIYLSPISCPVFDPYLVFNKYLWTNQSDILLLYIQTEVRNHSHILVEMWWIKKKSKLFNLHGAGVGVGGRVGKKHFNNEKE